MHTHETIHCSLQKNNVEFTLLYTINRIYFQQDRGVVLKAVSVFSLPPSGNFHSLLAPSLFLSTNLSWEHTIFYTEKKIKYCFSRHTNLLLFIVLYYVKKCSSFFLKTMLNVFYANNFVKKCSEKISSELLLYLLQREG